MYQRAGLILLGVLGVFLAGCCTAPLPPSTAAAPVGVASAACGTCANCVSCATKPQYSIAVTRPGLCNDFPVTYRVQNNGGSERVGMIERTELTSGGSSQHIYQACGR